MYSKPQLLGEPWHTWGKKKKKQRKADNTDVSPSPSEDVFSIFLN